MPRVVVGKFSFDRVFLRRFVSLLGVLYPKWCCVSTWLSIFVLIIGILEQVIAYFVGIVPSEFYVVLGNRDFSGFRWLCGKATCLVVAKAMSIAARMYSTSLLYLEYRRILCFGLHHFYFKGLSFYQLNSISSKIDNPDQRMTQDVDKTAKVFATDIFAPVILAPFIIGYYTYKTYASSGYLGPLSIYLYFVAGTIINKLLLSPIVNLVVRQERKEGDFRFKHVAIRSNAESIGFYHSGILENILTNRKLSSLLGVQTSLVNRQFFLNFSTQTFDYFGSIVSYMIIAIAIFGLHSYDDVSPVELTGIVSQNSFFYMYLIHNFSILISLSGKFGDLAGTTHRKKINICPVNSMPISQESTEQIFMILVPIALGDIDLAGVAEVLRVAELLEELKNLNDKKPADDDNGSIMEVRELITDETDETTDESPPEFPKYGSVDQEQCLDGALVDLAFSINSVTFSAPDEERKVIVSELTADLVKGKNVIITGDSGSGKTSLLRILKGLWHIKSGSMNFYWYSSPSQVLFLPQRPYFPAGDTLRQQMMYPTKVPLKKTGARFQMDSSCLMENDKLMVILGKVGLLDLVSRCGGLDALVEWDWLEFLSPGELQRLSMARVLYHKPKIVFLDEATSAIGLELEQQLYEEIIQQGITCVSVGHRLSLKKFHEFELHLDGRGGWTFGEMPTSSRSESLLTNGSWNLAL